MTVVQFLAAWIGLGVTFCALWSLVVTTFRRKEALRRHASDYAGRDLTDRQREFGCSSFHDGDK